MIIYMIHKRIISASVWLSLSALSTEALCNDKAGVYHNCSTRFADGFRYGRAVSSFCVPGTAGTIPATFLPFLILSSNPFF